MWINTLAQKQNLCYNHVIHMIEQYFQWRRESNPEEPIYITLCFVLQESGAEREEIKDYFHTYMVEGIDYDEEEGGEMIDYLVKIAQPE